MADYGHEWTDKRLDAMERKIRKVYGETLEEAKERLKGILDTFAGEDKKYAEMVEAGTMKKRAYKAWREETLGKAKHLQDMIDVLTTDFTNADKIAMKIVGEEALDVYATNANYAAFAIEKNMNVNLSWTLYDRSTVERLIRDDPDILPLPSVDIPMDMRWNRQHINAAITKGILLGDPIPEIAQRLVTVAQMGYNAAVRNARTATTAAECAGRIDTYQKAKSMGIKIKQQWLATLDGKTRHEHRMLDGQTVDIGEPFEVGGYKIRYPGDPSAPGYLIYNCRCTMISVDKFHDPNAPRASKLGKVSYEEWKAGKDLELQKTQKLELKQLENELKNGENRAILKEKIDSGEIPLKLNRGQQRKHIEGTHEYKTYLAQRQKTGKTPQNIVTIDEKELDIVLQKYATTGDVDARKKPDGHYKIVEYVDTDIIVGQYFKNDQYHNSNRVAIHYSSRGEHIFPVPPKKE
jgi:uncharacterized protein with gpF-like domain|nr:MAG TPA: minor capsid protein [Caudoviricetes sp.]